MQIEKDTAGSPPPPGTLYFVVNARCTEDLQVRDKASKLFKENTSE